MQNLMLNDRGGITYAPVQTIGGAENRSHALADVRMVVDGLNDLCAEVRRHWPERYPMPPELDAVLKFQDYAIARLRAGTLKTVAEGADQ